MQRKDEQGALWSVQKLLLCPFQLSYKILLTTLTVKLEHSSLTQQADPVQYSLTVPKEAVKSLTTWRYLKHTGVTDWEKGGERRLPASEESRGPPGSQASGPSCCRPALENKTRAWIKCNCVTLDTHTWDAKGDPINCVRLSFLFYDCSFRVQQLSCQSQTKIKGFRQVLYMG